MQRLKIIENQTSASVCPEICVEIISSSNTSVRKIPIIAPIFSENYPKIYFLKFN